MFLTYVRSRFPRPTRGLFALSLLTAAAPFAAAQTTAEHPYYGRLTLAYPTSSDLRDATNDLGFGVGVGYNLRMVPLLSRLGQNSVELNFSTFSGHGNDFNAFDLLFIERAPLGASGLYGGLGLGLTYAHVHSDGTGTDDGGGDNGGGNGGGQQQGFARDIDFGGAGSDSVTRLQPLVGVLLGYNLDKRSFVELGYRWAPTLEGVRHDLATISFGFRF